MNNLFLYLFFLLILSNCGIVKKNEIVEENLNTKIIFEKVKPIEKEFNSNLNINLTKFIKGEPFLSNNSNNIGNINFETNFNKTNSYKFSTIKEFNFNQPELIFTRDKAIIFFDGKGSIFKVNSDMNEIWKVNYYTKKERKLNPIIYFAQNNNHLIVADTLSKIYLINLENGDLIWSKNSIAGFNSNIKVYKDRFFVIDFDNTIRCFSTNSGVELWNFQTENPFIKSQKKLSLLIKDDLVFFINSIGDLTALNTSNGSLFWQTPTQSNVIYQDAFLLKVSDIVHSNNSIYFSNNKNEIFSIDTRSGIVNWEQKINSYLTPIIIENLIFSISEEGFLFVIDDKNGNIIRVSNVLKNIENKKKKIIPTGFIIAKNKIYLSLNNGRLLKINIVTGNQENVFKLSRSKILRPNVFDGNMYLFKENAIIKTY